MNRLTTHPLINEKPFRGVLAVGFACIAVSFVLFAYMMVNYDSCMQIQPCEG
jgi:hypothetical protein